MSNPKIKWGLAEVTLLPLIIYYIIPPLMSWLFIFFGFDLSLHPKFEGISELFCAYLGFALVYLDIRYIHGYDFLAVMGISKENLADYFLLAVTSLALFLCFYSLIANLFPIGNPNVTDMKEVYGSSPTLLWSFYIPALLGAPIVEETIFRGYIQPYLVGKIGVFFGILITAFIFTIAHVQYQGRYIVYIGLFTFALALGSIRHKTNSLVPSIMLHFLNNLLCCISLGMGN